MKNLMLAVALGAGLVVTQSLHTLTRAATPIEAMAGYWSGSGSVSLTNGKIERVKCVVTYKIGDGGTQIKQSMRCASADYTINAAADLRVRGAQVTGNWEERTYSATGEVSGRYSGD